MFKKIVLFISLAAIVFADDNTGGAQCDYNINVLKQLVLNSRKFKEELAYDTFDKKSIVTKWGQRSSTSTDNSTIDEVVYVYKNYNDKKR